MNIKTIAKNNPLTNYIRESIGELKKVVWPTKKEAMRHTIIVILMSLGLALFLGGSDYLLNLLLQYILNK